jgi:hypothetical protein
MRGENLRCPSLRGLGGLSASPAYKTTPQPLACATETAYQLYVLSQTPGLRARSTDGLPGKRRGAGF